MVDNFFKNCIHVLNFFVLEEVKKITVTSTKVSPRKSPRLSNSLGKCNAKTRSSTRLPTQSFQQCTQPKKMVPDKIKKAITPSPRKILRKQTCQYHVCQQNHSGDVKIITSLLQIDTCRS